MICKHSSLIETFQHRLQSQHANNVMFSYKIILWDLQDHSHKSDKASVMVIDVQMWLFPPKTKNKIKKIMKLNLSQDFRKAVYRSNSKDNRHHLLYFQLQQLLSWKWREYLHHMASTHFHRDVVSHDSSVNIHGGSFLLFNVARATGRSRDTLTQTLKSGLNYYKCEGDTHTLTQSAGR